jgi:GAF domain-containing protein
LCVIDHRRRDWSSDEIAVLRDIADALEQEIALEKARLFSRSAGSPATAT